MLICTLTSRLVCQMSYGAVVFLPTCNCSKPCSAKVRGVPRSLFTKMHTSLGIPGFSRLPCVVASSTYQNCPCIDSNKETPKCPDFQGCVPRKLETVKLSKAYAWESEFPNILRNPPRLCKAYTYGEGGSTHGRFLHVKISGKFFQGRHSFGLQVP